MHVNYWNVMTEASDLHSFSRTHFSRAIQELPKFALLLCIVLASYSARASEVTWIQIEQAADASGQTLPTVTVTGSINWGTGFWDGPLTNTSPSSYGGGPSIGEAIAGAIDRALNLSNVCTNPAISSAAKSTTSQTDPTSRWLAAQEIFNSVHSANLLSMYGNATRQVGLVIDGKNYKGFRVQYADGAQEVWVVNPGYATSSVKLFDSPAPNSMTAPEPSRSCTNG
jgi:hypothetical protein